MQCNRLIFSGHALRRMFERDISPGDVRMVVEAGEPIESYPEDTPYPSKLLLGYTNGRPLHIVLSYDDVSHECYVVTVYRPDAGLWDRDFKIRKTP